MHEGLQARENHQVQVLQQPDPETARHSLCVRRESDQLDRGAPSQLRRTSGPAASTPHPDRAPCASALAAAVWTVQLSSAGPAQWQRPWREAGRRAHLKRGTSTRDTCAALTTGMLSMTPVSTTRIRPLNATSVTPICAVPH